MCVTHILAGRTSVLRNFLTVAWETAHSVWGKEMNQWPRCQVFICLSYRAEESYFRRKLCLWVGVEVQGQGRPFRATWLPPAIRALSWCHGKLLWGTILMAEEGARMHEVCAAISLPYKIFWNDLSLLNFEERYFWRRNYELTQLWGFLMWGVLAFYDSTSIYERRLRYTPEYSRQSWEKYMVMGPVGGETRVICPLDRPKGDPLFFQWEN